MVLLDGVTVIVLVVAPVDHTTVPPLLIQPLEVKTRLCPLVIVAGLLTVEVILIVGAVTDVTTELPLVKLQAPFVATTE